MNSPHQREQLPDLLSDALDETERARVESHLAECEQCERELRALQQMQLALVEMPVATAPVEIRATVRATLRADEKRSFALPAFFGRDETRSSPDSRGALPFALSASARKMAWGGAAVVSAVGLMLLARPSLQNNAPTAMAPISEAKFAARGAAADENAATPESADDTSPATDAESVAPERAPGTKQRLGQIAQTPADSASRSPVVKLPVPVEELPPLPPPPARKVPRVESIAPLPRADIPAFRERPALPPAPKSATRSDAAKSRPVAPRPVEAPRPKLPTPQGETATKTAPETELRPFPKTNRESAAPTAKPRNGETSAARATRNAAPTRSPGAVVPAPRPQPSLVLPPTSAREAPDGGRSMLKSAPAPGRFAPETASSSESETADFGAPTSQAPRASSRRSRTESAQQSQQPSANWTGGSVEASLVRGKTVQSLAGTKGARSQPFVLTMSVAKAIGNARLFLIAPNGETQVWRGSLNALEVKVNIENAALNKARSGDQKIRARLEQIDGGGNPKASTTFDLPLP